MEYISDAAEKLCRKYDSRDPLEICDALGVRVRYKDLGTDIKAYYFCHSRIRNIVINNRVSKPIRRILAAHELGHDRLHRDIAMLKGFQELDLFAIAQPTEYEANLFAAEVLLADNEILQRLDDEDASFFSMARELYIPAALLDFKLQILKHKGYRLKTMYYATGDYLKMDIDGCFDEDVM